MLYKRKMGKLTLDCFNSSLKCMYNIMYEWSEKWAVGIMGRQNNSLTWFEVIFLPYPCRVPAHAQCDHPPIVYPDLYITLCDFNRHIIL